LMSFDNEGRRIVWHGGRVFGGLCLLWMDLTDPNDRVGVAIMQNNGDMKTHENMVTIAEMAIQFARAGQVATMTDRKHLQSVSASVSEFDRPSGWPLVSAQSKAETEVDSRRRLSEPFADWVGEYRHPFWGWLNVTAYSLTYGEFVATMCQQDCSVDWPVVVGKVVYWGTHPFADWATYVHPIRNVSGSVVAISMMLMAGDMPTPGTQFVTFASQGYEAVEQGWPRWEPVGKQRIVYVSSSDSEDSPPSKTPGFSTLEVILISVTVAWAVPVAFFCLWRCARSS